jgi:hypothetical protein
MSYWTLPDCQYRKFIFYLHQSAAKLADSHQAKLKTILRRRKSPMARVSSFLSDFPHLLSPGVFPLVMEFIERGKTLFIEEPACS